MRTKFSILVPLYNTPENFLKEMIQSVINQTYKNWELCLADASDQDHNYVKKIIKEYQKNEIRIVYKKLIENKGISDNTNACIDISSGNYYALLDHDDVLHERALEYTAKVVKKQHADFVYTDEAKFVDDIKEWFSPNYKPDFALDELRAHNYICHLTVYSKELLDKVGRYRREYDGSQDYDMVLRLSEKAKKIVHIPHILYYWRVHKNSVSAGVEAKEYAIDAARNAVLDHIKRCGQDGDIITHEPFRLLYHIRYDLKEESLTSIIIYGDYNLISLKECIKNIFLNLSYKNIEFIIITQNLNKVETEEYCRRKLAGYPYTIYINSDAKGSTRNIIKKSKGKYILFINGNTSIKSEGFIEEFLMYAQREDVACVGAKIYSEDGNIKDGGIALTHAVMSNVVNRFAGDSADSMGYEASLKHIRNVSAVSGECFMIEKSKYDKLGGLVEDEGWYQAISLGLRARQFGYVNVWTPYCEIISYNNSLCPNKKEIAAFTSKWEHLLKKEDPYYNKNIRYDFDNIKDKNTFSSLCKKSIGYFQVGGVAELIKRFKVYQGKLGIEHGSLHINRSLPSISYEYKEVLFINGCAPSVPHPPRYRVTHQREQLLASNIKSDEVYYEQLNPSIVKYYRIFIFFRCPYTENVGKLITSAKKFNKLVFFDVDDLVIDTKYTDTIPYVMQLDKAGKELYDDGVNRMGKTLKLCDAAITTTERLAEELSKYVSQVIINRNTASERMYELSEKAIYERDILPNLNEEIIGKNISKFKIAIAKKNAELRKKSGIKIGYFSGSITHNEDFNMIMPALIDILREFQEVELHLVGELDIPEAFIEYKEQIVMEPFTDWERLPQLIASVDINLAPITKTIFNEAKSENKWTEAALVKVPTIASNVGAFAHAIINGETGILCDTIKDWYDGLKLLILDHIERERIANCAYDFVVSNYITISSGHYLAKFIKNKMSNNIAFVLPSTEISGGIMVALKHASILQRYGLDVFIINEGRKDESLVFENIVFPVLSRVNTAFHGKIDSCVATMWNTMAFVQGYPNIGNRFYLVQNKETDFYKPNDPLRILAEQSYYPMIDVKFLTISKWVEDWLYKKYDVKADYIPNGIDLSRFYSHDRCFDEKIRILIEGDSTVHYKNVDESFKVIEKLDRNKFEVWYVSYNGGPKDWYRVDKFFRKVPYERMPEIYSKCHILLKSSLLESFSYPPLEMMATGGFVVAVQNDGNKEFLVDKENCLIYKAGDIDAAVGSINEICSNKVLRERLYEKGLNTTIKRSWDNCEDKIIKSYLD